MCTDLNKDKSSLLENRLQNIVIGFFIEFMNIWALQLEGCLMHMTMHRFVLGSVHWVLKGKFSYF